MMRRRPGRRSAASLVGAFRALPLPNAGTFFATVAAAFLLGACLAATTPSAPRPRRAPPKQAPKAEAPATPAPRRGTAEEPPFVLPPPPPARDATPAPPVPPQPAPATVRPPEVRVVLSDSPAEGVPVVIRGGWALRAPTGRVVVQGTGLRATLRRSGHEALLGSWTVPPEGGEVVPAVDGDLQVGARRYPGRLRIPASAGGSVAAPPPFRPQIAVDVETYLEGVVAGELPPGFPREARRAQAVIARTYLLSQPSATWPAETIQVDDSGLTDQEFVGIAGTPEQREIVRDAVASTRGLALFDGPTPLRTWYHSTCGGHTAPSAPVFKVPQALPLRGVVCDGCAGTKYSRWTATLPGAKVAAAAGLKPPLQGFVVVERAPHGRALAFEIRAGGRTAVVNAADFRLRFGPVLLRSTWIEESVVRGHGDLELSGRGWGHGVGLCQMGAKGMASRGATAEAMLAHYYPGSELRAAW